MKPQRIVIPRRDASAVLPRADNGWREKRLLVVDALFIILFFLMFNSFYKECSLPFFLPAQTHRPEGVAMAQVYPGESAQERVWRWDSYPSRVLFLL
jgi:hypothetical protein